MRDRRRLNFRPSSWELYLPLIPNPLLLNSRRMPLRIERPKFIVY